MTSLEQLETMLDNQGVEGGAGAAAEPVGAGRTTDARLHGLSARSAEDRGRRALQPLSAGATAVGARPASRPPGGPRKMALLASLHEAERLQLTDLALVDRGLQAEGELREGLSVPITEAAI